MSQNLKFKIKQFQWFQMQTRVRQIIQQVLGPIQKRILESSALINKIKTSQAEDELRIEEISLMIANDPKVFETGVFATVDRKFMEHSKLIEELSRQIEEENKYVENKFKILDLRMEESSEVLKNIASLKQRVSRQMQIQNDNINHLRTNIQSMIGDLNLDIRETRGEIVANSETAEKRDAGLEEEIRRIKQNVLTVEDSLALHREMHRDKTTQLEEHRRVLDKHTEEVKDLFDNKFLTKRLGDFVQDMDNEIKRILFKVDSITPLITQAQISECLSAILPAKTRNKISIYEYKKYYELNKQVLERDYKKVDRLFDGLGVLEVMQKKCTKEIIQLKRKKLLEMGIDIDHATYQQRQRYYSQISLDDELNMDVEEAKVTQKIDEGQIQRIIKGFFGEHMETFKQKIKIQIQDNKRYIYSLEEEIRHEVAQFQTCVQAVKNQCSAFHTEHVLEGKLHLNQQKTLSTELHKLQARLQQQYDLQRLFYNFCSLINHLSIQDQIDKQNISLMGTKEVGSEEMAVKEKNSVVAIDAKCFSCNGYPATTLTAFKMACLAYHPSVIRIDSKQYKREELLQFTTNMLQVIKKNIQNVGQSKTIQDYQQMPTQFESINSRQMEPGTRLKSQTVHPYDSAQKGSFKNSFISRHLETEAIQIHEERGLSGSKYRKKTFTTTFSSSYTKKKNSIKKPMLSDEMLKTTMIFNSLKKKNQSFLN